MTREHPIPPPHGPCDPLTDFILSVADFDAWSIRPDEPAQYFYRLRKRLANLPAGTLVTRDLLARYHAASLPATAKPPK